MGYCPYHNESKSGPSKGWYCDKAGRAVDSDLWNYCRSVVHCEECPIYDPGRAERERAKKEKEEQEKLEREAEKKRQEEAQKQRLQREREEYEQQEAEYRRKQQAQQSQSYSAGSSYSAPSYSTPSFHSGGSTGGGGGSGCFLVNIFSILAGLGVIAVVVALAGMLMNGLGFFRGSYTLRTTLPEGVSHRDYEMELVSQNPEKDYKVTTKTMKKDGTVELYLEKGMSSVYMIHDGVKFSASDTLLDARLDYEHRAEFQDIQSRLCRMVLIRLNDVNDAPIPAEGVVVQDGSGTEMLWTNVAENRIMVVSPEGWAGTTLTITVQGYGPLTVSIEGEDRLEGIDAILRPVG